MSNEINSQNNDVEKTVLTETEKTESTESIEKTEESKEANTKVVDSPVVKKETSGSDSTRSEEGREKSAQNKQPYQKRQPYQNKQPYQRQGQYQRFPRFRRKVCRFCAEKNVKIEYKNAGILERFITDRGKILPRRVTGTCAKHQRAIAREIKRARIIALIPYVEK